MTNLPRPPNLLVADAGPLIALARIDQLGLPGRIFSRVLVPQRVVSECMTGDKPGAAEIMNAIKARHLVVVPDPASAPLPTGLLASLGEGEARAIILTKSQPAATLLIDDRLGRHVAKSLGLRVIGVVGILVAARRRGDIPAVHPHIDQLVAAGYHLSGNLIEAILREVGER